MQGNASFPQHRLYLVKLAPDGSGNTRGLARYRTAGDDARHVPHVFLGGYAAACRVEVGGFGAKGTKRHFVYRTDTLPSCSINSRHPLDPLAMA